MWHSANWKSPFISILTELGKQFQPFGLVHDILDIHSLTAVLQQHWFPWDKTSNSSNRIRYWNSWRMFFWLSIFHRWAGVVGDTGKQREVLFPIFLLLETAGNQEPIQSWAKLWGLVTAPQGHGAAEHHPTVCIPSNSATHFRRKSEGCEVNSATGRASSGCWLSALDPAH